MVALLFDEILRERDSTHGSSAGSGDPLERGLSAILKAISTTDGDVLRPAPDGCKVHDDARIAIHRRHFPSEGTAI